MMKFNALNTLLAFCFLMLVFSGCGKKLQDSLAKPIEGKDLPDAAFAYNIGARDAQGNVVPNDTITFNTGGNKTSESGDFVRLSQSNVGAQIEGYRTAGELIRLVASQDNASSATIYLTAGLIETVGNMPITNVATSETINFSRSADPEAWAQARTAQFLAEAEKEKARDAALFGTINNGITAGTNAVNPLAGASASAFDILRSELAK
jgi:hypothetical protein